MKGFVRLFRKTKPMRYLPTVIIALLITMKASAQNTVKEILQDKIPVTYTGKAIDAYQYTDKAGEHIYLVTKRKDAKQVFITGAAYTKTGNTYHKDWEINDFGDDVLLHFKYTRITDIDHDGITETLFVYQLNPDDGGGSDWKMMLHYKNKKYVLRAHIPELDLDPYRLTLDPAFNTIPPAIKTYVKDAWNKIIKAEQLKTS
jgi:hypothetical protein